MRRRRGARTLGARFVGVVGAGVAAANAAAIIRSSDATVVEATPDASYGDKLGALVIDVTDAKTLADLEAFRAIAVPAVKALGRSARVIVLATTPSEIDDVEANREPTLKYVLGRNEQAMVHSAVGYARMKDRMEAWAVTASVGDLAAAASAGGRIANAPAGGARTNPDRRMPSPGCSTA